MGDDPADSRFWDERYAANRAPWEPPTVPAALRGFLAQSPQRGSLLIPGCGRSQDVATLAAAGWDVTAIDFSAEAVAQARRQVGPELAGRIVEGDFFTHSFPPASFDAIYERTFWCALSRERWPGLAKRLAELLRPGGELFGFYYFGHEEDGPPHGLGPGEDVALFAPWFELQDDQPVPDSLPIFAGAERWKRWRRRDGIPAHPSA